MSRDKFLKIKAKIKLSKPEDKNVDDRAWRVRKVLEIFNKNALQFGFFSTALFVDEIVMGDSPKKNRFFRIAFEILSIPNNRLFRKSIEGSKYRRIVAEHWSHVSSHTVSTSVVK